MNVPLINENPKLLLKLRQKLTHPAMAPVLHRHSGVHEAPLVAEDHTNEAGEVLLGLVVVGLEEKKT